MKDVTAYIHIYEEALRVKLNLNTFINYERCYNIHIYEQAHRLELNLNTMINYKSINIYEQALRLELNLEHN